MGQENRDPAVGGRDQQGSGNQSHDKRSPSR
jgi:hypothetical protein